MSVAAVYFGIWQAWTAISLSMNDRDGLDLRRFLVYPVPPGRIYLFGLASGLVGDPVALVWLLMLGGGFAGAALARPGAWLVPLAACVALFAVATVFLVALLQELLARLLASRRLKEIGIALSIAAFGWFLAAAAGGGHSVREVLEALGRLRWIAFPPALGAAAAARLYAGDVAASVPFLALLAAATALTGWASYRLALAMARSGGEGGRGRPAARPVRASLGPDGSLGALLEKEVRYLWRHPLARIYAVVIPAFSALVAWKVNPHIPEEAGEVVRALPLFGFALYTHLVLQVFWLNGFGWDRGGARALYLAPLEPARILGAKNAALYAFSLAVFAAAAALAAVVGGAPAGWAIVAAFALHAGLAPFLLGLGNVVSILNPRAAPFAVQRNGTLSWLSGLAGMAILSASVGLFALPVLAALRLDAPWLLVASWLALGAAGLALYRRTLPAAGRFLERRREPFLAIVCGDDA